MLLDGEGKGLLLDRLEELIDAGQLMVMHIVMTFL